MLERMELMANQCQPVSATCSPDVAYSTPLTLTQPRTHSHHTTHTRTTHVTLHTHTTPSQPPPQPHLEHAVCDAAVGEWHPDSQTIQLPLELREDEGDSCGTAGAGGGEVDQARPMYVCF